MKLLCTCVIFAAALFASAGCAKKEISSLQRKQAASLASEADFAVTVRDYARAESLLKQATSLCPDTGMFWVNLGYVRMRLGQRESARAAYRQALGAYEDAATSDKTASEPALQQVFVLALLGKADDARALQARLPSRYPNDREVRAFIDEKRLDQMLADPQFKALAL